MIHSQAFKVLVIDDFHPVFQQHLIQNGLEVDYQPDFSNADADFLKSCDVLALRSKLNINKELIAQLPKLKCIARGGAGMDNIDEQAAKEAGITLLNAPEGNRDAVAEHVIGLLLSMGKKITQSAIEVEQGIWNREANRGWEIGGKTVGIVGFGNTGRSLAKKLSGFDCKILAFDKYIENIESPFVVQTSFDELIQSADVISFNVPLTEETKGMINSTIISKMKDAVVLINTSRGGICKTEDVWNGIKSGKIKSFGADVLEDENPINWSLEKNKYLSEMLSSKQVIVTPHIAGWSVESYQKIAEVLSQKIIEYTTKVKNI